DIIRQIKMKSVFSHKQLVLVWAGMSILALILFSCTKIEVVQQYNYIPTDNAVVISKDTLINDVDVWDGKGKVLRINDAKISGNVILKNWIIDAPLTQWVFDTAINLQNINVAGRVIQVFD